MSREGDMSGIIFFNEAFNQFEAIHAWLTLCSMNLSPSRFFSWSQRGQSGDRQACKDTDMFFHLPWDKIVGVEAVWLALNEFAVSGDGMDHQGLAYKYPR